MTTGFALSEKMMPFVRKSIAMFPAGLFMDAETASFEKDTQEATDLVLKLTGGDVAVRVRRFKCAGSKKLSFDWSIRFQTRYGHKTEIDKLREGFGRWYFIGRSNEEETGLFDYGLIDLNKCREVNIFNDELWQIYPNGDGTAGGYFPFMELYRYNVVLWPEIR
jgi:hypothetical protein